MRCVFSPGGDPQSSLLQLAEGGEIVDEPAGFRPDLVPDGIELRADEAVKGTKEGVFDRQVVNLEL